MLINRDIKVCRDLVAQNGVKILSEHDEKGHTPLHWAALGGHIEILKFFINCGSDVNKPSKADYGPYPIHWACVGGHIMAVDLLLQNGANIDSTDNKGCTPLIISAQYGRAMMAGYLIGKGAKPVICDCEGDSPLHWAAFKGHSETVQLLLYSGFDPKQKDKFGQTPLHLACLSGDLLTVEHIVDMDVDLNVPDSNGKTPLMLAFGRNHTEVIHFMQSKLNRFVKCSIRDIVFGPPGRSRGALMFYFANLFCWGYPVYIYDVLPNTWEFTPTAHVLFILTNVLMWITLYYANKRNPGYLPCNTDEYDSALRQVRFFDEWQAKTGQNPLENLCHTCRLVRPLRAKHCRTCNRCVQHFDHHCPYINNCVGLNNRAPFFLFTVCVLVCCFITLYFAVTMLGVYGFSIVYSIGLVQFVIITSLLTALVVFQAHQIGINMTTNERINKKRYKYLRGPSGIFTNPFDRGYIKNCFEFFHMVQVPSKKQNLMYNI
ncbi:protein S-acyltransferase 24 isoform X2 [Nematostella vectensis]|uniref:protein S-acyltransferase 24 isoform X2 n=1 Tax=Nematostella vectensis TaxID=45351 RepID=UPI002077991F|nr:protein S-acyltransferase 24 isoform X2 [Nematostella vectensis]